jgi:hypothetical protein
MAQNLQVLVDSVVASTAGLPDPQTLAHWQPELSGDIDILIESSGAWRHDGDLIKREGLVRLFASLLRREADGDYYLVTPVEKWRVRVEKHALLAIDCDMVNSDGGTAWYALLNTGGRCHIGGAWQLHVEDDPYLDLPNGLTAALTRAAWYRLVDAAEIENDRAFILSSGERIDLGSTI